MEPYLSPNFHDKAIYHKDTIENLIEEDAKTLINKHTDKRIHSEIRIRIKFEIKDFIKDIDLLSEEEKISECEFIYSTVNEIIKESPIDKHYRNEVNRLKEISDFFKEKIKITNIENSLKSISEIISKNENPFLVSDDGNLRNQLNELADEISQLNDIALRNKKELEIQLLQNSVNKMTQTKQMNLPFNKIAENLETKEEVGKVTIPSQKQRADKAWDFDTIFQSFATLTDDPNLKKEELQKRNDLKSLRENFSSVNLALQGYMEVGNLNKLKTIINRIDQANASRIENGKNLISWLNRSDGEFERQFNKGTEVSYELLKKALSIPGCENKFELLVKNAKPEILKATDQNGNILLDLAAINPRLFRNLKALVEAAPPQMLTYPVIVLALIQQKDFSVLQAILEKADLNLKRGANSSYSPLSIAARYQSPENLIGLIHHFPAESFSDKNVMGETPLHVALMNNKGSEIIKMMAEKGGKAALEAEDNNDNTVLHLAAKDPKYSREFKALLEMASPEMLDIINHQNGSIAMMLAMMYQKDLSLLQQLLDKLEPMIRIRPRDAYSLLNTATSHQSPENLISLIPKFSPDSFSAKNMIGNTPLHEAFINDKGVDVIVAMAERGGEKALSATNKLGQTILEIACEKNDVNVIKALIGLKDKFSEKEWEALFLYAVENFDIDVLILAKKGLNLDYEQTAEGPKKRILTTFSILQKGINQALSAFDKGLPENKAKILDFIKDISNLSIDQDKNTILHHFIKNSDKYKPSIKTLLQAGADPYLRNSKGEAPIDWIMQDDTRRAEFLPFVRHLAELFEKVSEKGNELLGFQLANAIDAENLSNVKTVLKQSSYLTDEKISLLLNNALQLAARKGNGAIIHALLEAGGNPNFADEFGWTPLKLAAVKGNRNAFEVLARSKDVQERTLKEASELVKDWDAYFMKAIQKINNWKGGEGPQDPEVMLKLKREFNRMLEEIENIPERTKEYEGVKTLLKRIPTFI